MRSAIWAVLIMGLLLLAVNVFSCGDKVTEGTVETIGTKRTVVTESLVVAGRADTTVRIMGKTGKSKRLKEKVINYRALSDTVKLDIKVEDGTDSVMISYDLEYPEYEMRRVDTLRITVRDSSVTVIEEEWYKDGWFIGGISALILSVILLLIN